MKKFPKDLKSQKSRMTECLGILSKKYPNVKIQLNHSNEFELLISTMLSAQCTDARVNIVTESLFKKYKIPDDYLLVPQEELEMDIFSTGFYKAKAKNIRATCKELIDKFDGKVPDSLEELIRLPGVGRKTANVVLGHAFGVPGVVVDTHVTRISNRLGFVDYDDAYKIEKALEKLIPIELWVIFTHYFISFGREICVARKPKCEICPVEHLCPSSRLQ